MPFKSNWEPIEATNSIHAELIRTMMTWALPGQNLATYEWVASGCSNLNCIVRMTEEAHPYILRVYLRDPEAAWREQKLASLIGNLVPLPDVLFVGECQGYHFAVTQYCAGITLRDLLLWKGCEIAKPALVEVGLALAQLHKCRFSNTGFFDCNLDIPHPLYAENYFAFAYSVLKHPNITAVLSESVVQQVRLQIELSQTFFTDQITSHLVHGDFGPENILVAKHNGEWRLSAILDWEFAFAGSGLADIANMLRYAHRMPALYERFFLIGLNQGGIELPSDWQSRIDFLNLVGLLDCLTRCELEHHPNRCADIHNLIDRLVYSLANRENGTPG